MGQFRDQIRGARKMLHDYMADRAICFDWPVKKDGDGENILIPITIRVHEKFLASGDLAGTNYHYAEVEDDSPVGVFWLEEITPYRGMRILTEYGHGFMVDSIFPPDDQTQNAKLIPLTSSDMTNWPTFPND